MKIVRFRYKNEVGWGVLEQGQIRVLKEPPFNKINLGNIKIPFERIKLLAPAEPSKIILAGLNYKDHARELGMGIPKEPVIFIKPATSIIAHNENIIYPYRVKQIDYEAELAFLIKKQARNIHKDKVHNYILGYTCLNDVTSRDLQKKDGQWTRAKSFDTFCPIGPWIETEVNPDSLSIKSYLNGRVMQDSNTSEFIFSIEKLVCFISGIMTLCPGDVISTGTPAGVSAMHINDIVEVEIEGIGRLKNRVVREK